ncbi:high chlorophyll fluorescent 107 protein [Nymphaea thermarum]|nr:high chlorophyll fluorescent 107 protein [Nymphaea thermarum]
MSAISFGCRLPSLPPSPSSLQNPSKILFKPFPHPPSTKDAVMRVPSCTSKQGETSSTSAAAVLDKSDLFADSNDNAPGRQACVETDTDKDDNGSRETTSSASSANRSSTERATKESLVIRRPVMDAATAEDPEVSGRIGEGEESADGVPSSSSSFASYEPEFSGPETVRGNMERPLRINLELALYRAKILTRNHQFNDAEKLLRQCMYFWPEDGRPYVALGRTLRKQSKTMEARAVYEQGCQATQGENSYIWQCWAVLEQKVGNIRRARELFDAATVADEKHVAAWHGWAILEIEQGNIKKARNLLGKGLKCCGANEYIYQTLALLEARGSRTDQARYFFRQATICNPKSCASWLAWAQMEVQQENTIVARKLFERAVQASPKNRFAWHVWALFEVKEGNIDKGRKLLKIGHTLNRRDPVLLQSLALLEYKHSSANLARELFKRAADIDPKHQPVWTAWGWMEWKEGNISTARKLYQKALSVDSASENAARCLQAWGVLEQRVGNLTAARRLFRSSLNINSQSYVTWMTWASLEEQQGNAVRAEEIRNLYFQQRTEIVDDASWVMGFLDMIDPAVDSIKKLLNLNNSSLNEEAIQDVIKQENYSNTGTRAVPTSVTEENNPYGNDSPGGFDVDAFVRDKLSLDPSQLEIPASESQIKKIRPPGRIWKATPQRYSTPTVRS